MTTTRTYTAVLSATAVVAGAAGVAGLAASGPAAARPTSEQSFTVRVHRGSETNVDLGKPGFSAGDEDLLVAGLTRGTKRAGRIVGNCTTVRVARSADQLCEFVLRLGGGQITASGTVRSDQSGPGVFALAILGGTGRYQGAVGQVVVTPSNSASFPLRVELR